MKNIFLGALLFSSLMSFAQSNDLIIKNYDLPEWENSTTILRLEIQNKGPEIKEEILINVSDLDLTVKEAKKLKIYNRKNKWIFEDNEWQEDDDENIEVVFKLNGIGENKTENIEIDLGNHWVFDPNCELKVELDSDKKVADSNLKNNIVYILAGG